MKHAELLVPALLVAVAALSALARAIRVPYPILLVVGGLGLGFVPGVPDVQLNPDLVLALILPPLLYSAAFFSSLRDLRADLRSISTLAIGLVLATTVTVAVVMHAVVDGLPWAAAFALGAIVSPTDPLAATAMLPSILDGLSGRSTTSLLGYAALVSGVVIATRLVWLQVITWLIRMLDRRPSQRARRASWRVRVVNGWAGLRGSVSLAAALALPTTTDAGTPFPSAICSSS